MGGGGGRNCQFCTGGGGVARTVICALGGGAGTVISHWGGGAGTVIAQGGVGRNCHIGHICHVCHICHVGHIYTDTSTPTCSQATPILLPGNPNPAVHSPWKPEWQF